MERWIKAWGRRRMEAAGRMPWGCFSGGAVVFIITTWEAVCDSRPLLSLLVAPGTWQTLALSAVVVDPSIRNFDVAHISTASTSDFSDARDFCLLGKGIFPPLPPPHRVVHWDRASHGAANILTSEAHGRPQGDLECSARQEEMSLGTDPGWALLCSLLILLPGWIIVKVPKGVSRPERE